MCETWTLAVLTLITSSAAISRLVRPWATRVSTSVSRGVSPRSSSRSCWRVGGASSGGAEIEPRPLGQQLELALQGPGADAHGYGMCVPQRRGRLGAGRAGGDERLGLAPAAVGRDRRALEPVPRIRRARPEIRPRDADGRARTRPPPGRASPRRSA